MPYCAYCGSHVAEASFRPCPSCGRPSNGAPAAASAAGASSNKVALIVGLVIGFFVIIAIIGILAAIAIPNLLTAKQRAMQKRTLADMRIAVVAIEEYAADHNGYPQAARIGEVERIIGRDIPTSDAWEHDFKYECLPDEAGNPCAHYALASGGKDGVFEHESLSQYEQGTTSAFDSDIVYSGGRFVQMPETGSR
jgi:type II secretory pathway pseudopilin PulG